MNKEYFIKKAQEIHRNKYDYSLVEVSRSKDKVKIICPIHGVFVQEANSHLQGRGCAICSGKKFDLDTFIRKANKIWNNKYDYSKVVYTGTNNKVCIICPEHGEFWQTVSNHLKGQCACKECRGKSKDFKVIRSKEDFIKVANEKYNYKFDYSKVDFKGSREKVCIICPEHGEFWQLPYQHLNCKNGCPKCTNTFRFTQDEFIKECEKIHPEYTTNKTVYTGITNSVILTCPKHGDFSILASTLIYHHGYCPDCAVESYTLTKEDFIRKAREIHGWKYDYSEVNYINYKTPITIICPKHGKFEQLPGNHLKGCKCPECAREQIEPSKGELFIKNLLNKYHCKYKFQYEIKTKEIARNSNKIIVDFIVKHNDCIYIIEYNGKQHYEFIPFFHNSQEDFQKQIRRDNLLRKICSKHPGKLELIEIPYNYSNSKIIDTLSFLDETKI